MSYKFHQLYQWSGRTNRREKTIIIGPQVLSALQSQLLLGKTHSLFLSCIQHYKCLQQLTYVYSDFDQWAYAQGN